VVGLVRGQALAPVPVLESELEQGRVLVSGLAQVQVQVQELELVPELVSAPHKLPAQATKSILEREKQ